MKRILPLLLAAVLVLSASVCGFAETGAPPGGGPGGPGGRPGGAPGGPGGGPGPAESAMAGTGNSLNTEGLIAIKDGQILTEETLGGTVATDNQTVVLDGLHFTAGDYGVTAVSASGSRILLRNALLELNADSAVSGNEQAGTGLYTDSGITVIEDSEITVNGAGRYTTSAVGDAILAVRDSVITAGGDRGAGGRTAAVTEPASNAGLLISGTSRANFSVGQTHTFYYDSLCAADAWAALSTDSASGSGLEFVAVDTEAAALHGGYGIYADSSCRDYLYGCTLVSAEIGAILSNNGALTADCSESAAGAVTQDGYDALAFAKEGFRPSAGRSLIIAGRNDFQLHSPDMMGDGSSDYTASLSLSHTDLVTEESVSGEGFPFVSSVTGREYMICSDTDYAEKYGGAVGAYVDYVSGAAILVKSTSADIRMNDVTVDSFSGVALLSALNSDSMSRYLKRDAGNGVNVLVSDSSISGDIVHDDYQRDMSVTFDASTLSGAVTYSTAEQWNARWAEWAGDENACWAALDSSVYVTGLHETSLTLTGGSVWNVTEPSRLTMLRVSPDSSVNGTITAERTDTLDDGTRIYYGVSVSAFGYAPIGG